MTRTVWTDEEQQIMREAYATTPNPVLARDLGRSVNSIFTCARRLGLTKPFVSRDKDGRPATLRAPILASVTDCTDPAGASFEYIIATTGMRRRVVSSVLSHAKACGALFSLGADRDLRYFTSVERMEECRAAVAALMAVLKAERIKAAREKETIRSREKRARKAKLRPPKPPKPPKPVVEAAPRHRQKPMTVVKEQKRAPAPVLMNRGKREVPQKPDLPVVIPAHVRVQVIPTGKDYRYSVSPHFVGEFTQQWRELRK